MDLSELMKMAGNMKEQFAQAQEKAAALQATGESGGGMVKVTMNGKYETVEVKIEPEAMDLSDVSLLEDLVRAASTQASRNVAERLQDELGKVSQGMGLDLSQLGINK